MKAVLSLSIAFCLSTYACAQEEAITVAKINTLDPQSGRNRIEFLYQQFFTGKIVFADESYAEPLMNYNRLTGQMLFLTPKGDTLALARPETTAQVVIGTDTFVYYEKTFLQKVTHNPDQNLYVREFMKFIGKEKKGPYGTYSPVSAANSSSTYTYDDNSHAYISIDEKHLYKPSSEFFIADAQGNIYPANKQGLYKAYADKKDKLKTYIESTRPNYSDKDEMLMLIRYMKKA